MGQKDGAHLLVELLTGDLRQSSRDVINGVLRAASERLDLQLLFVADSEHESKAANAVEVTSRGSVRGSLYCVNRRGAELDPRDWAVMTAIADMIAQQLDREAASLEQIQHQFERVRDALVNNSMQVLFQPILSLEHQNVVGVEALARFTADMLKPPDIWFAEAEAVGLGRELEIAAAKLALSQLDRLPRDAFMSVNVSPETVLSEEFRVLAATVPVDRVVLEITEHLPVQDYGALREGLRVFRNEGMRIAIDDAGAGFATMGHILGIEPDLIKLDMSLIRGIDHDPIRQALASSLCSFSSSFNATVVAEGVETPDEEATLRRLGITLGQGFGLGVPAALTALSA